MNVLHKLVGYERQNDGVAAEYDIPQQYFARVKQLARVDASDPDAIGAYPLDPAAAQELAKLLGQPLDTSRMDFFLEPDPV